MLKRRELLAGRFELRGDPAVVVAARRQIWKQVMLRFPGRPSEDQLWLPAIERATGRAVRVAPRGPNYHWAGDQRDEQVARRVFAAPTIAGVVPLLHVGPGIVYAEPPRQVSRPRLGLADAAECALAACEVVARVHALGLGGAGCLYFGPHNLRVVEDAGRWRIAWLVPGQWGLDQLDQLDAPARSGQQAAALDPAGEDPVARDRREVVAFFVSLLADEVAPAELAAVVEAGAAGGDVAGLARLLLWFVADPGEWTPRVDALPVLPSLPRWSRDWDATIAEGEAILAVQHDDFVPLPLAAAYHQRACRRCALGKLTAALTDLERAVALDDHFVYRATQATLLDRLGRAGEAREVIAAAVAAAEELVARLDYQGRPLGAPSGFARALATRGLLALRAGQLAAAEVDLRRAVEFEESADHLAGLGAVLHARGDAEAASRCEARAVELEPMQTQHRWALIGSLLTLGRVDAAREHAQQILRQEPDDRSHRARFARMFGGSGA